VIGVVQADADELADVAHAGADARRAFHGGQAFQVELLDLVQGSVIQYGTVDVLDVGGQIADLAGLVEDAGLFLPHRAVTQ
jgi:hypothetical protein